jgi:CO/xanthine dehydrogenase Mo-binding subunit
MERLLDLAATELGIDRVEIRRRNLIGKDDFPHHHGLIYQDFTELTYDSGDYEACLDQALEAIDYQGFESHQQPEMQSAGRNVGIALVTYVEGTGIGPYEGARVTVENSGNVTVATGIGTQGQGHFTSFAQIVAEQLGVAMDKVQVTTGDTQVFHWGSGTFASRGAVVAGTACHTAALEVRRKILDLGSELLEAPREDLVLEDGAVMVRGVPDRAIPLGQLAAAANPLRGAVTHGSEPGLEASSYFGPARGTTANGVHAMIVEVDPETFDVEILRYVVVHDCGTVINPLILEGQIVGGVAQGIGNAFYEKLEFDDQGQLLNASFMDYLIPTATDVPLIESSHRVTPSPLNPLGIKGAGEAGAIPVGALFAAAIEDALGDLAPELLEIPLSPNRLFDLVQAHRSRQDTPS